MKKNIFLTTVIAALLFSSCDYMSKFDNLDELSKSTDVNTYNYTVTDADYSTIAAVLKKNKTAADSATANLLTSNKVFSVSAPASKNLPYLLTTKYIGENKGSSANITYNYKAATMGYYTLSASDYSTVWGIDNVKALTPAKSPSTVLPGILAAKYPTALEGDIKVMEYEYSTTEPTSTQVEVVPFLEDFEAYTAGTNVLIPTTTSFAINKDVKGSVAWQCRTFSSNKYAQVTSNGSKAENEVWLITNKIDLSAAVNNASFKFDVTAGYYNADCLTILVSQNYDGTEAGISSATWTDITSNFTLPKAPASGYGTLASAGTMGFAAYAGKKVYIAFKYNGSAISSPVKTTTFQIDNIKVSYNKTATAVATTQTQFAYYQYTSGAWTLVSKSYYQLAANDYTDMGITSLTAITAPNYIPSLLKLKFPFAQEGSSKVVVYKASATANNADEYVVKSGVWTPVSLVQTKTDQFVFSGWDVNGWVFDPTIYVTMKKGINATDDYMLVINYVKENLATNTPSLLGYYGSTLEYEYYYGFDGYHGNISWKDADRLKDPSYAALTSDADKTAYLNQRTQEGLAIYLGLKFPNTQTQVSGIDVYCYVTTPIYDPKTSTTNNYKYKYQRVDNGNLKWKYISSEKL